MEKYTSRFSEAKEKEESMFDQKKLVKDKQDYKDEANINITRPELNQEVFDTFKKAQKEFAFVLNSIGFKDRGEVSFGDWAAEIKKAFNLNDPNNQKIYVALTGFPRCHIKRGGDSWEKGTTLVDFWGKELEPKKEEKEEKKD